MPWATDSIRGVYEARSRSRTWAKEKGYGKRGGKKGSYQQGVHASALRERVCAPSRCVRTVPVKEHGGDGIQKTRGWQRRFVACECRSDAEPSRLEGSHPSHFDWESPRSATGRIQEAEGEDTAEARVLRYAPGSRRIAGLTALGAHAGRAG
jgi:hypothetical protein